MIDPLPVHEHRQLHLLRNAGQFRVEHLRRQDQRDERRVRRCNGMTQFAKDFPARSIAAAARERSPAGGDDHPRTRQHPIGMHDLKGAVGIRGRDNSRHPAARQKRHLQRIAPIQQRLEHSPRRVGDREEFSGRLAFEFDAKRREPANGRRHVERRENVANDVLRPVEIFGEYFVMSDVTSPAAGDENLRAKCLCPIQNDDPKPRRRRLGGKNRRRQTRRTTTDNRKIRGIGFASA